MDLADMLAAMDLDRRADFVLETLADDDEERVELLVEALDSMGAEGFMSMLDAVAEARKRGDDVAEGRLWALAAG